MRKLSENGRRIVLELPCQVRGRALVVEVKPHGLELREKGCRTVYLVPWAVAYWVGAKLAAESRRAGRRVKPSSGGARAGRG